MFALRGKEALKEAGITHVVSVLRQPLDAKLFEGYEHHIIEVDDVEDENIIQYFAGANEFIKKALEEGGAVLIHCAMGKSRSTTILAQYLMQSQSLTPAEAVALIKSQRSLVEPNEGFMKQLELYHAMKYETDLDNHPMYQRWLYQCELEAAKAAGVAPERVHFRDAERRVAEIAGEAEEITEDGEKKHTECELRCKKCRRTLATSKFLTPHIPKSAQAPQSRGPTQPCSHHFLEPLSWMRPELEQQKLEGKLECPKCQSKVGSYAWQGMKCSCGEWIVPAISLARGRVDEVKIRATQGLKGSVL
ncbi:protein-tyrosine phosphatase-like protein [Pyronema omphalodes]|nr:protein-tyrosine phosphatase-like protein [Pyronema omphalodes]